ncbi:hypothetical protein DFQ03_0781 [Maribacter caenipelagi]|uniref:Uncharacterized protein n=1 Tax=Maribacter caenipelagi TaxID=1447781 RepID=A0A4R7DIE2_9FLAO|nr:hypothetical protein [Maribacter caenipelagi]TDS19066.1 hypothetical protein DFQ03_0781 [Maribacter caenipelagi]|tara:strand:+ start:739 stop:1653 length:915 start_codon:yes stop_codon:yes gene_type:complete
MRQIHFIFLSALLLVSTFSFAQDIATINIVSPNENTAWNIPDKITLKWNTVKIDTSKSIRFFLVRNEMVVQELGSFKNDGFEDGIELAKNIGSGNRYQVVAIELFPDDKFNIAKKVTPFFSITNAASDERKKKQQLANVNTVTSKKKSKSKKKTKAKEQIAPKETAVVQTKNKPNIKVESKPENNTEIRDSFDGRKISYTKEFEFSSEDIVVKIWDHGRQDGDIVSIYLNGVQVIKKYYLTYWKKEFKIKLDSKKSNDLFLYAHNLGDSPPNTVSLEISDGKKSENIVLNSDLQSCEAVLISVK